MFLKCFQVCWALHSAADSPELWLLCSKKHFPTLVAQGQGDAHWKTRFKDYWTSYFAMHRPIITLGRTLRNGAAFWCCKIAVIGAPKCGKSTLVVQKVKVFLVPSFCFLK